MHTEVMREQREYVSYKSRQFSAPPGAGKLFWIVSYPKSGNTWMRIFIHALQADDDSELDINSLISGNIASSSRWVAEGLGFDINHLQWQEVDRLRPQAYRYLSRFSDSYRYHKVHDAQYAVEEGQMLFPLEATRGALLIVRNPLDVSISLANHLGVDIDTSIAHMGNKDFKLAAKVNGQAVQLRQYIKSWSDHVASWLESGLPLLLVRYEDMRNRPEATFTSVARFLQLPADKECVKRALDMCRFEGLQSQESERGFAERPRTSKRFFRKGIVGDWRNELSSSQVAQIIAAHREVMQTMGYLDAEGELTSVCG